MSGGGGDDVWLVSYADLMTLLFGFFVLMYFFASEDKKENWEKVRKEMAEYFGGTYVNPNSEIAKQIEQVFQDTPFKDDLDVKVFDEGLEVTFRSSVLFESGQARLTPAAVKPMSMLVEVVSDRLLSDNAKVIVEGHTDDNPISTVIFQSNWELSAGRATTIVRIFEENGVLPNRMRAVAFGESRPLFPNFDEHGRKIRINQAKNRRVVIRVIGTMELAALENEKNIEPAQTGH